MIFIYFRGKEHVFIYFKNRVGSLLEKKIKYVNYTIFFWVDRRDDKVIINSHTQSEGIGI